MPRFSAGLPAAVNVSEHPIETPSGVYRKTSAINRRSVSDGVAM